jgi:hypothetical protein
MVAAAWTATMRRPRPAHLFFRANCGACREGMTMHTLYMFRSKHSPDLSCYCGDSRGAGLPERFAPWTPLGVLRRDQQPPHGLSRQAIEAGIAAHGFQLMRVKKQPSALATEATRR